MIIGFSGTRRLDTPEARASAAAFLDGVVRTYRPTKIVTGGCIGFDALVAELASEQQHIHVHTVLPSDRSRVAPNWRAHCTTFEELPPSAEPYRARNKRLVALCDRLAALPEYPEQDPRARRSGTWMAVRIARRAGKQTIVYRPLCTQQHEERQNDP